MWATCLAVIEVVLLCALCWFLHDVLHSVRNKPRFVQVRAGITVVEILLLHAMFEIGAPVVAHQYGRTAEALYILVLAALQAAICINQGQMDDFYCNDVLPPPPVVDSVVVVAAAAADTTGLSCQCVNR